MFNKNQLILLVVALTTLTFSVYLFWQGLTAPILKQQTEEVTPFPSADTLGKAVDSTSSSEAANQFRVQRVIDGDTVEIDYLGTVRKLRYIGIDTPETVDPRRAVGCFGKEASDENKRLVEGKTVYLEKDVSETDKFDRLLKYVYLKLDDGSALFVNDYLVRQGFALSSTYPPDVKYQERFNLAQKEAMENNRGLWAKCK